MHYRMTRRALITLIRDLTTLANDHAGEYQCSMCSGWSKEAAQVCSACRAAGL